MSDDEIDHHARELQAQPLKHPGRLVPWELITEASKEYWREKVRRGERAYSV